MKNIMKYWLLAASAIVAMPILTACDDNDEPKAQLPTEFTMEATSLNIAWDETEGYVEFGANGDWKAEPLSAWIKVDPNSGEAGDHRVYLLFEANPYRLPRTGQVQVTCGEQTGLVQVTQAGCTDDSKVAPCQSEISIESLDYNTGEIDLSAFTEAIQGNLGLSLAEFANGVADEGNLEFFAVDKDGKWVKGGTAGTRCGAWFDSNLNVAGWDGSGYPANALFLEVPSENGEAKFVIGRAPGVPDDAEFTLNFGFTFTDDHSKYCLFRIDIVFPALDLEGEIVKTIDLTVDIPSVGYEAVNIPFDAEALKTALGCSSPALAKIVSYDADGKFIAYTGNDGYWFNSAGEVSKYEDGAWFIEYHGAYDEATEEEIESFAIGTMPGTANFEGTCKVGMFYNGKVVMYNVKMKVGDAPATEE